ncbi:hypothetical protein GCM10023238_09030 [Streptomyces heliomycini]
MHCAPTAREGEGTSIRESQDTGPSRARSEERGLQELHVSPLLTPLARTRAFLRATAAAVALSSVLLTTAVVRSDESGKDAKATAAVPAGFRSPSTTAA